MSQRIAVIGSTGLIGRQFLESIAEGDYEQVSAITRRPISSLKQKTFINQAIHDFSDLDQLREDLKTDVLICAMGTTIKTAGSQAAFTHVDHDLPLAIAKIALEEGCQTFILISSIGANPESSVFYSRVKGQLESDIQEVGFKKVHILRPSLLLGNREESRPGELVGKLIAQPLAFMIPWKYKPIHAQVIALTIQKIIAANEPGVHIWEGKPLFKSG